MASFLGFDLNKTTEQLFVNARESFENKGYETRIDVTDENNPVFIAEKQKIKIELPINKNVAHVTQNKKTFTKTLDGVTVYNGEDFYVSKSALNMSK